MDRIYFRDIVNLVWVTRWYILWSTVFALAVAAVLLASSPRVYLVSMTLAPTDANKYGFQNDFSGSSGSSVTSALLGLSGGDKSSHSIEQFLELFRSSVTLGEADKRHNLLARIFRNQWDPVHSQWVKPDDFLSGLKATLNMPGWSPPTVEDGKSYLIREVQIEPQRSSSLVHVSMRHQDPQFAVELLTDLYQETDALLRERERARNNEHIAYIQNTLSNVNYTETRQSLTGLLASELTIQVLINTNAPYIMEILEPPTTSTRPVSPSAAAYGLGALVAGIGLAFFLRAAVSYLLLAWPLRPSGNDGRRLRHMS